MKKTIVFSLSLILGIMLLVNNVYAASSYKIDLNTVKNEFDKKEEFVVNVAISNIQVEKGLIAFGAVLDYDKDSLELVKTSGSENWANPSYNENNGKLTTDRNNLSKNDEVVFSITFRVKEGSKANPTITLKNIEASGGTETGDVKTNDVTKTITVKGATSNPNPDDTNKPGDDNKPGTNPGDNNNNQGGNNNNQGGNNQGNNNQGGSNSGNNNQGSNNQGSGNSGNNNQGTTNKNTNTNKNNNKNIVANTSNPNNKKDGSLPKAGTTSIVLGVVMVAIAVALIFYAKIRILDKNNKH